MCDNLSRGVHRALLIPPKDRVLMVEELEQQYGALKDKVRTLREYL